MQRIDYAGGSYVTGDEIAQAVLDYATVLAAHGEVDVVALQVTESEGVRRRVRMLVGAALPIAVTELGPGNPDEVRDDLFVADLVRRAADRTSSARTLTPQEVDELREDDGLAEY